MSKQYHPNFKPTVMAAALLVIGLPSHAAVSPFAPLPLHMSVVTGNKTKSNVLLVLDNSGSMQSITEQEGLYPTSAHAAEYCTAYLGPLNNTTGTYSVVNAKNGLGRCDLTGYTGYYSLRYCTATGEISVDGKVVKHTSFATCNLSESERRSRMDILKITVKKLVALGANKDVRWGISYLNKATYNKATNVSIGDNKRVAVENSINQVVAGGGTPLTESYVNAIYDNYLVDTSSNGAIQYRCQPSFAIALTDGAANGKPSTIGVNARSWIEKNWGNSNGSYTFSKWFLNSDAGYPYFNNMEGLKAPASIFANTDLRTSGNDREGGSWDDKNFNDGKQSVVTSTIGFGVRSDYLINGAQGKDSAYYKADNAEDLADALQKALEVANAASNGYSTVLPSVNATSSTNFGAVSLTLDLMKGNSHFQFLNLARNANKKLVATVDGSRSVTYGSMTDNGTDSSRRVLLSNEQTKPKFLVSADVAWKDVSESSKPSNAQYREWLLRPHTKADSAISGDLRSRDSENPTHANRMMGDVIGSSVLQVLGSKENTLRKYLITAANDGMVHMFLRNDGNATNPYQLKANWIPGAASREAGSSDNTVWNVVQNTTKSNYITSSENKHAYLLNGGLTYRITNNGQIFAVGSLGQGGKGAYAFNIGGNRHDSSSVKIGLDAAADSWIDSIPLWETANKNFAGPKADANTYVQNQKMGYPLGAPMIGRLAMARDNKGNPVFSSVVRYAAAVNNGYYGADTLPALYVYDALGQAMMYKNNSEGSLEFSSTSYDGSNTGKLLAKIVVPNDDDANNSAKITGMQADNPLVSSMNNGLSAPTLVDVDLDGLVDVGYAGDLNGNMYRFDFRKEDPSKWSVQRIFKGSAENPITAAPSVFRKSDSKLIVMFGTGRDLHTSDLAVKTQQYFYGIYDDLSKNWGASADANTQKELVAANRNSDMLKQEIIQTSNETVNGELVSSRFISNNNFATEEKRGWFVVLGSTDGERVVVQPTVVNNAVFFTTRIYSGGNSSNDAVCLKADNNGYSWLMGVNVNNGGGLSLKTSHFSGAEKKILITGQTVAGSYYVSGIKQNGVASATSFLNLTRTEGGDPPSINEQGQLQDGRDTEINASPSVTNFCTASGTSGELQFGTSASPAEFVTIQNALCKIHRLSWREIF